MPRAAYHRHQRALAAVAGLVGNEGEHLVAAKRRLVDAQPLAAVLREHDIAAAAALQALHALPVAVAAQLVLVQVGKRLAVHAVKAPYRLDGKRLRLYLLLLKKPRTQH